MSLEIKICGITDKESPEASREADYIGFVFYQKSPRFINAINAKEIKKYLNSNQKIVGLFVNADNKVIQHITEYVKLDFIQLHGEETKDEIIEIKKITKKPIIKAIKVESDEDIKNSEKNYLFCDMLLFDTKISNNQLPGGSGKSFDWKLLKNYNSKKKWMLAGGLNISNIHKALRITNAPIIDISSGVERRKGIKCKNMIKEIIELKKNYVEKN